MKIRPANPEDVAEIVAIERVSDEAAHWTEEEYRRVWSETAVSRQALVAEEGTEIAGFLVARHVAGEWELENIAVKPELRGRGIGAALLGNLLELLRARQGVRLMLEVRASNQMARKLYDRLGLRISGQRKCYYQNPPEDAILYDILV